ncbi:MAG: hypothetical protein JOY81_04700, partial [Alphaproteobacteria bacterium]|nr:hypothetical protein [Alphaproteobacteria bacterium]
NMLVLTGLLRFAVILFASTRFTKVVPRPAEASVVHGHGVAKPAE